MILDEFIDIKWHSSNKKYLTNKGYFFTKIDDIIRVKVIDLKINSHVIVHVKCDICGNDKYIQYKVYNKNIKSGGYYGCSNKCSIDKYLSTNLNKYGNINPMKVDIIKKRLIETNLKKYGVKSNLLVNENKEKIKQTNLKKHGNVHHTQCDEFKNKVKEKSLIKYGVDSFFKTNEFKFKTKKTNIVKYNSENPSQNKDIKEKIKQTNLKKYGVECVLQSKTVREKIKQSFINKYGVDNPTKLKYFSEKAMSTMIEKYGEIWINYAPKYNPNSIYYLDLLSEKLGLPIQHALNGGEKKFIRYWVDGYIEKYNICIEWDEKHHNSVRQIEKDLKKDNFLKEKFNCKIFRIKEKEFLNSVDYQITNICDIINNIIKNT